MKNFDSPLAQEEEGFLTIDPLLRIMGTNQIARRLHCAQRTAQRFAKSGRTFTIDQARFIAEGIGMRVSEIWPELEAVDQDPKPGEWVRQAKCRGADQELFFPSQSGTYASVMYARAKRRYCSQCPVRAECLEEALLVEEKRGDPPQGLVGGLMPKERAFLLRARRDAVKARYA